MNILKGLLISISAITLIACGNHSGNTDNITGTTDPDDVIPPIVDPGGNTPITTESLSSLPSSVNTEIDAVLLNYVGNSGASLIDIDLILKNGVVQIINGEAQSPQSTQNLAGYSYAGFVQGADSSQPSGVFGILSPDAVLSSGKTITYNGDAFGSYIDKLSAGAVSYDSGKSVITVNYEQKSVAIQLKDFAISNKSPLAYAAVFDEIRMNSAMNSTSFMIDNIQFYKDGVQVSAPATASAAAALFGYDAGGYASEIGGSLSLDSASIIGDFSFLSSAASAN